MEEGEFDNEEVLEGLPAELGHKLPCSLGRTAYTNSDQIYIRNKA